MAFAAPGDGYVTVSLTGSSTLAHFTVEQLELFGHGRLIATCNNRTLGIDQSCPVRVAGGGGYLVRVYEDEGRSGTTHLTMGWRENLGTPSAPVPVSVDSLVNGSVGALGTSHFSFVARGSTTHTIAVAGPFTQLAWELFADPAYTSAILACAFSEGVEDLACAGALTAGSTYFLRIRELSGAPQQFRLTVGSGVGNEGDPARPVMLTVGAPPRASTADVFGRSYYTFTPNATGPHSIRLDARTGPTPTERLASISDYAWTLFAAADLGTVVAECRDYRQMRLAPADFEHCVAPLVAGVTYTLRVDERAGFPNRVYDLSVVPRAGGGGTSEGSVGAPVAFEGANRWGRVAASGTSYYSFRTAAGAASSYRIITAVLPEDMSTPGSNLSWALYGDASFASEVMTCARASGIAPESCLTPALAPSTTYYLRVDEHDGIAQMFDLDISGGSPPLTQTSPQSPATIPVGTRGLEVVQDNTLSTGYYTFTTAEAGTYRISADLAAGGLRGAVVAWSLYDDAAAPHRLARCLDLGGMEPVFGSSCTVALAAGQRHRLVVQPLSAESGYPGVTIVGNNDLHLAVQRLP